MSLLTSDLFLPRNVCVVRSPPGEGDIIPYSVATNTSSRPEFIWLICAAFKYKGKTRELVGKFSSFITRHVANFPLRLEPFPSTSGSNLGTNCFYCDGHD